MSYPQMAQVIADYFGELGFVDTAAPFGSFRGGALVKLEENHVAALLLPSVDPDEALTNCLAHIQDLDLYGWDVADEVVLGRGAQSLTVLHLKPEQVDS